VDRVSSQNELTCPGTAQNKNPSADLAGPVVILVRAAVGENIGMAARANGQFRPDAAGDM